LIWIKEAARVLSETFLMIANIRINRAPVLTLWAAVVAERLGFDWEEALTLGRAVAGLNAYSKGVALGLYEPTPEAERERRREAKQGETMQVGLLHRAVPVVQTPDGLRALSKDRPISPGSVERYLQSKFGDHLDDAKAAMAHLAHSIPATQLARRAYSLYENFRPEIPAGARGWGAIGDLDLNRIRGLVD
jgi:hypothetical protein